MAYAILDTFARADESLLDSPNYDRIYSFCTVYADDMWVQSNQCGLLNDLSINDVYWTHSTGSDHNQVGLVFAARDQFTEIKLWARLDNPGTAGLTGYMAAIYVIAEDPTAVEITIWRFDDCGSFTGLITGNSDLSANDTVIFACCGDVLTVYINNVAVLTTTDATYSTGEYIGWGIYGELTRAVDFGGGTVDGCSLCNAVTSATITADPNNTSLLCEDQTFTASYLPVDATAPVTYTWSTDGLQSGQGTATAVYNWTETCTKTVTVTVANACGSASASTTLSVSLTLMQIAEAIAGTLTGAMTPTLLSRTYGYDEIPEAVNDAPSMMVYWQSIVNDRYTDTDRTSFAGVRVKELMFRVDYYQNPRNNMEENNDKLTQGADEIINILEQEALGCTAGGGHCPPFGLCGLKTFRWSGERVTFDYGGVLYYGARFEIIVRVF